MKHRNKISGTNIYNKATGELIPESEIPKLQEKNIIILFEPVINMYGGVESYQLDLTRTHRRLERDVSLRVSNGEKIPPFVMQSIDKKIIDSEELKKLVSNNVL